MRNRNYDHRVGKVRHSWMSYNGSVSTSAKCTRCGVVRKMERDGYKYYNGGVLLGENPDCLKKDEL